MLRYTSLFFILSHSFFLFTAPPTTEIYTLSLHDALPICHDQRDHDRRPRPRPQLGRLGPRVLERRLRGLAQPVQPRSEEHTSELQSRGHLVCRLLLEKKKKIKTLPSTLPSL